jgi:hypothetical protein
LSSIADGVGLRVDLLAVEQALDLLTALRGEPGQRVLGHGEHATRAAGAVVQHVGTGLDLVLDRQEHEVGHQAHGIARRPVLAGFFVVLFVELADQLLEHRAHRVVVDAGRGEIDVRVQELGDQRAQRVGARQRGQLIPELEVLQDVLHVRREAVEVVLEVRQQLLLAGAGFEVTQGEAGGVVEGLPGGLAQCRSLFGDASLVEHLLGVEHGRLGGLQHGVHAPDDAHRQDHVRVLAAPEQVTQDIVGDAPDERDDLAMCRLIHPQTTPVPHISQISLPAHRRICCTQAQLAPSAMASKPISKLLVLGRPRGKPSGRFGAVRLSGFLTGMGRSATATYSASMAALGTFATVSVAFGRGSGARASAPE